MIAAELGHTEVAEVLINHKADLFATEKVCLFRFTIEVFDQPDPDEQFFVTLFLSILFLEWSNSTLYCITW